MNFINKIIVITGGANGIGKSIVEEFKKSQAKVAIIDMDKEGIDCDLYFCGDIAEENSLEKFTDEVISKYGKIDFLINNACISKKGIISDCSYDDFNYVLKVGVTAPYMLAKLFLPHFNVGGAIVNISSTRAYMSQADTESYTAAKGGISSLTHALSISLAGKVRVNCISPGWIDTTNVEFSTEDNSQHPSGRVGKPIDIAKIVMFLCSEDSGFITGENITVDGGMSKQMIYHDDFGWQYKKI
jgi:NAD(P)-dependent dehydrogenase (short-subunit alcohol dehydrogenase family)